MADPRAGPVAFELTARDLDRLPPGRVVRGRVVDDDGRPVEGAVVSVLGVADGNGKRWGQLPTGVDPLAVTDGRGEFRLGVAADGQTVYLGVDAQFLAPWRSPGWDAALPPGGDGHTIRLDPGATVAGQVVKDGSPVAGVPVGLVQRDRSLFAFVGDFKIATGKDGKFEFRNVPAGREYVVYGLMDGTKPHGALPARPAAAGGVGSKTKLDPLAVEPGITVAGRVELADGKPVPNGVRVLLSRAEAWDTQTADVGADGRFQFNGVPAETVQVTGRVPGYHPSPANAGYHRVWRNLVGRAAADGPELRFLFDPGPEPDRAGPPTDADWEACKGLEGRPLGAAAPEAPPGGPAPSGPAPASLAAAAGLGGLAAALFAAWRRWARTMPGTADRPG